MTVLVPGDRVLLDDDLVHDVVESKPGKRSKYDGSLKFYNYKVRCSVMPILVTFDNKVDVQRTRALTSCLWCLTNDVGDEDYNY